MNKKSFYVNKITRNDEKIKKKYVYFLKLINIQFFFTNYKINFIKFVYNNKNNIILKVFTLKNFILQKIIYQTILPIFEYQTNFFSFGFLKKKKIITFIYYIYKQIVMSRTVFLKKKRCINKFLINLNKKFIKFSY